MLIQQQPTYILHARPWRETSLLLECLTRDLGCVGVIARGARRPRARNSQSDLQPFQELAVDFSLRGELGTLRTVEVVQRPLTLKGTALLAGLYVNELVVRMSGRQDPHSGLYDIYRQAVQRLASGSVVAWALRRFERDFLDAVGYAMELRYVADSRTALDAETDYLYLPEQGPVPTNASAGLVVRGSDLLALAADCMPDADGMQRLRRLSRGLLLHHLGGVPLRSWQVLSSAARRG
ncbi:MAG TPA: DNA repair protein RecO [Oleiagrimonas sp.]|nr:DNA repair protein RecO [Oleiagrimonas sp.]